MRPPGSLRRGASPLHTQMSGRESLSGRAPPLTPPRGFFPRRWAAQEALTMCFPSHRCLTVRTGKGHHGAFEAPPATGSMEGEKSGRATGSVRARLQRVLRAS